MPVAIGIHRLNPAKVYIPGHACTKQNKLRFYNHDQRRHLSNIFADEESGGYYLITYGTFNSNEGSTPYAYRIDAQYRLSTVSLTRGCGPNCWTANASGGKSLTHFQEQAATIPSTSGFS